MGNILIVGAGAVGCLLAALLSKTGHHLTLVARGAVKNAIDRHGVIIMPYEGESYSIPIPTVGSIAYMLERDHCTLVIVAVKSNDTAAVAAELAPFSNYDAVLSVQNGIGNEETLYGALGEQADIIAGAVTTSAKVIVPGTVQITNKYRDIALATVQGDDELTRLVRRMFHHAGMNASTVQDHADLKWSKLLMNMTGNASSAVLDMPPNLIFADKRLVRMEIDAAREALNVMAELDIQPINIGDFPVSGFAWLVRHDPTFFTPWLIARKAGGARGSKMPSLHADVEPTPRGKTEVGWLSGAVVREADRLCRERGIFVPVPVNRTLTALVSGIASGDMPKEPWRGDNRVELLLARISDERTAEYVKSIGGHTNGQV